MNILDGLYLYLRGKTAITDLIGTGDAFKLFPELCPQNRQLPYVVFEQTEKEEIEQLLGASNASYFFVSFDVYSNDVIERQSISNALRNILHTRRNVVLTDSSGNTTTLEYCSLRRNSDGLKSPPDGREDPIMCKTMDFMLLIREAVPTLP